jgi:chemotaxis protein CheD
METRGSSRKHMQAEVYGGASLINAFRNQTNPIGVQNAQFAQDYLTKAGIEIASKQLGGQQGMKVSFETHTGLTRVETI